MGGITAGPEGALWFTITKPNADAIGRITTSGAISEYPLPTVNAFPGAITMGSDGNLWFTEGAANAIARMTPGGAVTEFPLPTPAAAINGFGVPQGGPVGITKGADGNVWFTQPTNGLIGRITPSGAITEFPLPQGTTPIGITPGPGGNVWFFTGGGSASKIGRITPTGGVSEFAIPSSGSFPYGMTEGPGRQPVVHRGGGQLDRTDDAGRQVLPVAPLLTRRPAKWDHDSGPRGELWFTEEKAEAIGWVKPAPPEKCVVPKLKGKTLAQAKRLLSRAHCKLGKVTKGAAHGGKSVVATQKPAAKKSLPVGTKVSLRLG